MRNFRFWIPPIIGALVTPITFFAAVSAHNGHAGPGTALFLYPANVPITVFDALIRATHVFSFQVMDTILKVLLLAVAVLQFPFYGFVLSYAHIRNLWWLTIGAFIIYLHLWVIAVWAIIAGIMWLLTSS